MTAVNTGCPRCGGTVNRLLAPGFFECTSTVVDDLVPPGAHGNPSAVPITRVCGHHFQVNTGQAPVTQCTCGTFAIGTCRACGQARCGVHGSLDGGSNFVCNEHISERERRLAVKAFNEAAAKKHRLDENAAEIEARRQQMLSDGHDDLPEFPTRGGATAAQLSEGLQEHAPDRSRSFVVELKSLGRTVTVRGWGFAVSAVPRTNSRGGTLYQHRGVIVTDDGRAFVVTAETPAKQWTPGDHAHGPPPIETDAVPQADALTILSHVARWTGKSADAGITPARTLHLERLIENGTVTQQEADGLAPEGIVSDAAWATIRDR